MHTRKPPLQDVIVKPHAPERSASPRPTREAPSTVAPRPRARAERRARPVHDTPNTAPAPTHEEPQDPTPPDPFRHHSTPMRPTRSLWPIIAVVVGGVMIATAIALSMVFGGATVIVYPKQDTLVADVPLTAAVGGAGAGLAVERVALEQTAVEDVIATGEEEVEERARGTITIYNEYSTGPQRLITQTRFQADDGKIYRIQTPVEVPGKQADGTPGTLEATVIAEEPGEAYNRGPGEFSVPGFEGRPQEGLVYARSTEAFTGGFAGIKRNIQESDRLEATQKLENQLRDELLARLATNEGAPEGYQLYPGSAFFEFNTLPDEIVEEDRVRVTLQGTLHAIAYPEDELARSLAQNLIGSYAGSPIRIENSESLTVVATADTEADEPRNTGEAEPEDGADTSTNLQPWDATTYDVQITGKAEFVWEFDTEALRESLAGLPKQDLEGGMSEALRAAYPGIDYVHATSRPFWKRTLPNDTEDIIVTVELDG